MIGALPEKCDYPPEKKFGPPVTKAVSKPVAKVKEIS